MWKKEEKSLPEKVLFFSLSFPDLTHRQKMPPRLATWAISEKFTEFTAPTKTTK